MLKMRRRDFVTLLGGAAAWPLAARAQQPEQARRIGVLMGITDDPEGRIRLAVFRDTLRALGWSEGANVEFSYVWGAGSPEMNRRLVEQLLAGRPDVILSNSTPITLAVRQATSTVPVVFMNVSDPIESGVVESLARPTGNLTGFSIFLPSIVGKWLELLRGIEPGMKRVAFLFSPDTCPPTIVQSVTAAAPVLGIEPIAAPVRQSAEIARVIETLPRSPDGGLLVLPDVFTSSNYRMIIATAAAQRLPAIYPFKFFVRNGGLMSYGVEAIEPFRQAASYIDRILRGTKPSDLPVHTPNKWELVINPKTAKALALVVPDRMLVAADEVIE